MRQFHALTVSRVEAETPDSMRISLDVPDELRQEFDFLPGQHLPIQFALDGRKLRRTYSICSAPGQYPVEIGVRVQPGGRFGRYAASELSAGDRLDSMPPSGRFYVTPDPSRARTCVVFAAGSGITPVLSIVRTLLELEPHSRVMLFYGNRRRSSTMFIDDLYALKNRFPERLQLHFVFSQEQQEFPIMSGRLDAHKVRQLYTAFCGHRVPDEAYICGPGTMLDTVRDTLVDLGMNAAAIHIERYGVPREVRSAADPDTPRQGAARVTLIMDGHRQTFDMPADSDNIVDAAAECGIELPYSCKGGVCATCRTFLREGEVEMRTNYALEPWEVEKGFVLACQSRPVTEIITIDYDQV
jgi:ring-1,2-phenylacetyl-CoA epoxidase subunit PaaE